MSSDVQEIEVVDLEDADEMVEEEEEGEEEEEEEVPVPPSLFELLEKAVPVSDRQCIARAKQGVDRCLTLGHQFDQRVQEALLFLSEEQTKA